MDNLIKIPDSFPPPNPSTTTTTTTTTMGPSIVEPVGLQWPRNELLSNAKSSKDIVNFIGISDFNIFNPYIHYTTTTSAIQFSTSGFMIAATQRFEAYSSKFRDYKNPYPLATTTTTTTPPPNDCITTILEDIGNNRYAVWCVNRNGVKTRIIEYT
jgi:hypothetical protein